MAEDLKDKVTRLQAELEEVERAFHAATRDDASRLDTYRRMVAYRDTLAERALRWLKALTLTTPRDQMPQSYWELERELEEVVKEAGR